MNNLKSNWVMYSQKKTLENILFTLVIYKHNASNGFNLKSKVELYHHLL